MLEDGGGWWRISGGWWRMVEDKWRMVEEKKKSFFFLKILDIFRP